MASGTFTLFSKNKNHLNESDLSGATLKAALLTSAWTPDNSVTGNYLWADISANEIAAANGYTAGGAALSGLTVSSITGGYKLTASNTVWTPSGGSIAAWRNCAVYVSGTLWSLTNPLVGYFLGDTTPADIPAASGLITITWNASGLFDAT